MNILMINTEFNRGGAAQIARTLFQSLNQKSEFECYFAYGRGEKVDDERTIKFTYLPEVHLQGLLTRCFGLQGYGSWFSTKKLEKFIIKEKFDLIHLHNIHGYYLNINFVNFLGKLRIPVVWTLHDSWPMTGRCACSYDCEKWKWECGNCPDLSLYPKTYIDSTALMWKKKRKYFTSSWNPIIICPSQWLADRVKKSYLNKYKILVIPNSINTELFTPRNKDIIRKKLGISSQERVILIVSSDLKNKLKGIKCFFGALKNINIKNCMVITIGKKINLNKEIKINFNIKQLGYIKDKNTLSEIYNASDIFCSCSLDEVFGLVVTEALSSGIPVVGFRVGGIPEQVTEDCGILVNPKDSEALGRTLEKLLNDDELRKKFSENCRKRVLQNCTIEKFTDNYIKVYNNILRGGK